MLGGDQILTCACVVKHARRISVQTADDERPFSAEIVALATDLDLALIRINDPHYENRRGIVALATRSPQVGSQANLLEFGRDSTTLASITAAVSRSELQPRPYGGSRLQLGLAQIASFADGRESAVNHQSLVGLISVERVGDQNMTRFIPNEEVQTFLDDVKDGRYDGKSRLCLDIQRLENPALRTSLNIPDHIAGVLFAETSPQEPPSRLQCNDVITKIAEHAIDNQGRVHLADRDLHVDFRRLAPHVAMGGSAPLTVLRVGKEQRVDVPVSGPDDFLVRELQGAPSYFVWGPLALVPASQELVDAFAPMLQKSRRLRHSPLLTRRYDLRRFPDEELVVATLLYPHETSRGYRSPVGQVVSHVNDVPIRNLRHLVTVLRTANTSKDRYIVFRFVDRDSESLVFDRQQVMDASEAIHRKAGIFAQGSADVLKIWNGEVSNRPIAPPYVYGGKS